MAENNGKTAVPATKQGSAVAQTSENFSDRFMQAVIKEFSSVSSEIAFTPYQKKLAQHLLVKIDTSLKDLEIKRQNTPAKKDNKPITWENVNMEKLATDAVDRIDLGLDALIPNHIHVIPYFNGRKQKYDLDLRVGYAGKDLYYRQMAVETPENIVYELVHENDVFLPKMKSIHNDVESYEFEITQPFKRGQVIGGFGYIMYKNQRKNKLILVSAEQFERSQSKGNATFWKDYPDEMKWKTVVTKTVTKLQLDPEKINKAFLNVEAQEQVMDAAVVAAEIDEIANKGPVIDITTRQEALTETAETQGKSAEGPIQEEMTTTEKMVKNYTVRLSEALDFTQLNLIRTDFLANEVLTIEDKNTLKAIYQAEAKRLQQPQKQEETQQQAVAQGRVPGF
jgi:recombination protein RecT